MTLSIIRLHKPLIALAAITLYWGCHTEDLLVSPNETKTVQLGFSLSDKKANTRMSAGEIIGTGNLDNITLIPFYLSSASKKTVDEDETPIGENVGFKGVGGQNQLAEQAIVPFGTNAFLVYAKEQSNTEGWTKAKLDDKNTKAISFSPVSYASGDELDNVKAQGQKLLDYLTVIANTQTDPADDNTKWSKATGGLGLLYKDFIGLQAGSSTNVLAMVQSLYTAIKNNGDALSETICKNILTGMSVDASGILSYKTEGEYILPKNYPMEKGLPAGSAAINWDNAYFKFVDAAVHVSQLRVAPMECYTYPAEIWYRANSRIKTSSETKKEYYFGLDGVPLQNIQWTGDGGVLSQYENDESYVGVRTQSVAIKEQLQYAVARFDIRVRAENKILKDNKDVDVEIKGTDTFPLTGILVGGQRTVDFEFKQIPPADNGQLSPSYTVYDPYGVADLHLYNYSDFDDVNTKTASTLLLESYPAYKLNQSDEYYVATTFALEFENCSGLPFTGIDGKIISPGCKFYLIGDIIPENAEQLIFEQDKITKADVLVKSLRNAYYIIPDLRDPQLKVGLTISNWRLSTPSGPIVL